MFYKSVLEQMHSVSLMNLYIFLDPYVEMKVWSMSRLHGCALDMQLSWQLNMLMRNLAHSFKVENSFNSLSLKSYFDTFCR